MRKGFTLVEILIVIVIMSVLASMMTVSMSESKISADASNIVSRLRNAKTAAMAMYVDSLDKWEENPPTNDTKNKFTMENVRKFLNNDRNYNDNYVLVKEKDDVYARIHWYVAYNLGDDSARLAAKLANRTQQDELLGSSSVLKDNGAYGTETNFEATHKAVLLRVK